MRRPVGRLAPLILIVALAPACGSGSDVRSVRVRREDVAVATPVPPVEHPLTGLLRTPPQEWQERAPIAIKVENSEMARPQSGLDAADVVYEELAEGGITRFIAVFHSAGADKVGPVRSARLVDPNVLAPMQALFAYAGGVEPVVAAVRANRNLVDVGIDRAESAYWRQAGRKAPHNLYTSTASLWKLRSGQPPAAQFVWLAVGGPAAAGAPGRTVTFSFAPQEQMSYAYDEASRTYRRFHGAEAHLLENGAQVAPVNVVLQFVSVRNSAIVDRNGQPSPESTVTGEGEAIVLTGGQSYRGRWVRPSLDAPPKFLDAAGNPIPLARGRTWIELLPSGRPISIG